MHDFGNELCNFPSCESGSALISKGFRMEIKLFKLSKNDMVREGHSGQNAKVNISEVSDCDKMVTRFCVLNIVQLVSFSLLCSFDSFFVRLEFFMLIDSNVIFCSSCFHFASFKTQCTLSPWLNGKLAAILKTDLTSVL